MEIRQYLECVICREITDNMRVLLCGHSFCHTCITKIKILKTSARKQLSCPTCRRRVRATRLMIPYQLNNVIKAVLNNKKSVLEDLPDNSTELLSIKTSGFRSLGVQVPEELEDSISGIQQVGFLE